MAYVARIVRKDGSMVEKECATRAEGDQWVAQNGKSGDKGHAVVVRKR